MRRYILIVGVAAMALSASFASAQSRFAPTPGTIGSLSQIYDPGRHIGIESSVEPRKADALTAGQIRQLIRWGAVGECVVARDRVGSVAYLRSDRVSKEKAAARQLDRVFASCLNGSGIIAGGNKAYRRAALADALDMRLD